MMVLTCFLYVAFGAIFILGEECDKHGILIYEDLGCSPEFGKENQCPVKYSCEGLEPSEKSCYFRGKSYEDKESVDSSLSFPSCSVGCFCSTHGGRPSFTCAVLDCPEWLGVHVPPGCYRNYTLDHCCSVGQICPPFDSIEKCVVGDKEYKEGERFNPPNSCLDCVCQKGFKGKLEEPFCRRRLCGQQLRQSGKHIQDSCAPFYIRQLPDEVLCCPDDWICPDGAEVIQGDAKSEEVCKFGNNVLKVGQHFEKVNIEDGFGRSFNRVKCECVIPPLVNCRDL